MPLYEYHCQTCAADFELLIRSNEQPSCPACHEAQPEKIRKQFSVPAGHVAGNSSLPMANMPGGGCGKPQCGSGGCGM